MATKKATRKPKAKKLAKAKKINQVKPLTISKYLDKTSPL